MAKINLGNVVGPQGPQGPKGESGIKSLNVDGVLGTLILVNNICIQWGYYVIQQGDTWEKVNLNIPYKNTNYNIQICNYWRESNSDSYVGLVTETGFNVGCTTQPHNGQGIYWMCIGEV